MGTTTTKSGVSNRDKTQLRAWRLPGAACLSSAPLCQSRRRFLELRLQINDCSSSPESMHEDSVESRVLYAYTNS